MTFLGSRQEVSETGTVLLAPIKAITVVKTCFHALLWGRPGDINPGNVCVPTDDGATLNVRTGTWSKLDGGGGSCCDNPFGPLPMTPQKSESAYSPPSGSGVRSESWSILSNLFAGSKVLARAALAKGLEGYGTLNFSS